MRASGACPAYLLRPRPLTKNQFSSSRPCVIWFSLLLLLIPITTSHGIGYYMRQSSIPYHLDSATSSPHIGCRHPPNYLTLHWLPYHLALITTSDGLGYQTARHRIPCAVVLMTSTPGIACYAGLSTCAPATPSMTYPHIWISAYAPIAGRKVQDAMSVGCQIVSRETYARHCIDMQVGSEWIGAGYIYM